jgi:class 3 adenylate cyclase
MMPNLMEFVWRRHLGAAARRRIMRAAGETTIEGVCVGFADLVGFTAQTQQLQEDELAQVVDRFEAIAYDVVADHGGRIVKTIGDEVMFLTDDVRAAALIAMDLAERYRDDEQLSDVRVGLAVGRVLERDGDVYGPVVNMAHRIVTVAYPSSVVVSPDLYEALKDDPDFVFKSIRSHYLKDIGRIPLWTLRRASDPGEPRYTRAQARRLARREFMLERRRLRQREAALLAERRDELDPEQLERMLLDDAIDADEPTTAEYEALTDAVLEADIDTDLQVELLTDIEAARRLHELEQEAAHRAQEADLEAERKLDEIEEEAKRKVREVEKEARIKVEAALLEAEEKARRANEEASRKVKRVAEEAERKADRAEKEAKREAKRKAARRKAQRDKATKEAANARPDDEPAGEPHDGPGVETDGGPGRDPGRGPGVDDE